MIAVSVMHSKNFRVFFKSTIITFLCIFLFRAPLSFKIKSGVVYA